MLQLESVSKQYRTGNYGVRDVSLSIGAGVLGLLGPNGAGKTTLMQLIATVTRPTQGRITFAGLWPYAAQANASCQMLNWCRVNFTVTAS